MKEKEVLIIPTDEIWNKFQEHLEIENNNRILFSWKYWTWKTYFLNKFFETKKEEYEVFHLYPINYQISSNDDILKFLKYDILVELLKKNPKIYEKIEITNFLDYSILTYLFFTDKENILKSIKTWIEFIPDLGRPVLETVWIFEKFFSFKKQIEGGKEWIVKDFLEKIKDKNITETDLISELIKNKINEVKWHKKSILILDDLDRIDPEHIFRLLNIFWAHYDNKNNNLPNKFWFDKIMLVCDYENIKSIFHHKYWKEADFNWYIDKFYSVETFKFDNNLVIESFVENIIQKYVIKFSDVEKNIKDKNKYYNIFLNSILTQMVWIEWKYKLNLRWLLKPINFSLDSLNIPIGDLWEIENINILLKTLEAVLWKDKKYLVEVLKNIKNKNLIKKYKTNKFSEKHFDVIYWFFIFHIYSKIINYKYDDENVDEIIKYKDYSFTISKEQNENITLSDKTQVYNLFYDILIDYINNNLE